MLLLFPFYRLKSKSGPKKCPPPTQKAHNYYNLFLLIGILKCNSGYIGESINHLSFSCQYSCRNPRSNQGPLDLHYALPTELFRQKTIPEHLKLKHDLFAKSCSQEQHFYLLLDTVLGPLVVVWLSSNNVHAWKWKNKQMLLAVRSGI